MPLLHKKKNMLLQSTSAPLILTFCCPARVQQQHWSRLLGGCRWPALLQLLPCACEHLLPVPPRPLLLDPASPPSTHTNQQVGDACLALHSSVLLCGSHSATLHPPSPAPWYPCLHPAPYPPPPPSPTTTHPNPGVIGVWKHGVDGQVVAAAARQPQLGVTRCTFKANTQ